MVRSEVQESERVFLKNRGKDYKKKKGEKAKKVGKVHHTNASGFS